jgi:hypothetical protein
LHKYYAARHFAYIHARSRFRRQFMTEKATRIQERLSGDEIRHRWTMVRLCGLIAAPRQNPD